MSDHRPALDLILHRSRESKVYKRRREREMENLQVARRIVELLERLQERLRLWPTVPVMIGGTRTS